MMNVVTLLLSYLAAINLIGFALMGIDKYKAKKRVTKSGNRITDIQLNSSLCAKSTPSIPSCHQKPSNGGTT